jgi:hypothetical protein
VIRLVASRAGLWLTAILAVSAVAALWALLAIVQRAPLPGMVLPLALAAGIATRTLGLRSLAARALTATALTWAGSAYALGLTATERLSRLVGRGFVETAIAAGPEMIAALAWYRVDASGKLLVLTAPFLAMAVAGSWRDRRDDRIGRNG